VDFDMSQHLGQWLRLSDLERIGGELVDVIVSTELEPIRNRFTRGERIEPVLTFQSGWRLIPNHSMRRLLVAKLGPSTGAWVGVRLRIYLEQRTTKEGKVRWQRGVEVCAEQAADEPVVDFRRRAR
jgi:hypothetical protein